MSYTLEVLNKIIASDGGTLVGELPQLKKEARISFRCKCGIEDNKSFVRMKISGMLCKTCTNVSNINKRKMTNLERYGASCTLQAESIKKKAEESCMKRFGVKNVFESDIVQQRIKETNIKKYGAENPFASPIIKQNLRETCKKKYGTEFPMQNKDIYAKTKATNLIKYGVPVSSQAECVKEKAKQTNMRIYGNEHHIVPEVMEKAKKTNMAKYGVEYSFQAKSVKDKIKETMYTRYGVKHNLQSLPIKERMIQLNYLKYGYAYPIQSKYVRNKIMNTNLNKYGVKHVMQSALIQEKSQKNGLRYKNYITPSGEIRKVQGYEPFALDILFKEFAEDDILTSRKEVPRICYKDGENKDHYYFPDIWIKSLNKIIEVKSTWTYKLHWEKNAQKWEESIKQGYDMEVWIFTPKGERTIITNCSANLVAN